MPWPFAQVSYRDPMMMYPQWIENGSRAENKLSHLLMHRTPLDRVWRHGMRSIPDKYDPPPPRRWSFRNWRSRIGPERETRCDISKMDATLVSNTRTRVSGSKAKDSERHPKSIICLRRAALVTSLCLASSCSLMSLGAICSLEVYRLHIRSPLDERNGIQRRYLQCVGEWRAHGASEKPKSHSHSISAEALLELRTPTPIRPLFVI